jgi:STE24 endopeptidase
MQLFDPDAATAAYMATISASAHAKATAYTQGGHWILLWNWIVSLLAAVLIIKSGLLPRLRNRLGGVRKRPNLTVFCCAVVFFVLDFMIELPWSVYVQWWRETSYALTTQSFMGWLGEEILSAAISTTVIAIILVAIYALMRRVPRYWWAYAAI